MKLLNPLSNPHGGDLLGADSRYGRRRWIDFSSNVNPLGVPQPVKDQILRAIEGDLTHYPDPLCRRLRAQLAHKHGTTPERVMAGNGVSELLMLAVATLPRGPVLLINPCYLGYRKALETADLEVRELQLKPQRDFLLAPGELASALRSCRSLILGNPNNPTSVLLPPQDLLGQIKPWLDAGGRLIIDEAFVELTLGSVANSLWSWVRRSPNVLVLRAFTKSLALPGLRLGYALGEPAWLHRMAQRQPDWSVNAMAQSVGAALDQLGPYRAATAQWLASERDFLCQGLSELANLRFWPPKTNFILCQLQPGAPALEELELQLAQDSILIRNCQNFAGLDDSFFRIAIRDRGDNQALLEALGRHLGKRSPGKA